MLVEHFGLHGHRILLSSLVAILLALTGSVASAATYDLFPPDLSPITTAQPGDTFILHYANQTDPSITTYNRVWTGAGTFHGSDTGGWITIMGAPNEHRPLVAYNDINKNIFDLPNVTYVKFLNIEVSGGSDIFKFTGTCHDIILDGVYMHNAAPGAGGGVNASGITEMYNLTVRNCEIGPLGYPTIGEGFYLGHHYDSAPPQPQVHDSLIERNYVHDTGADGVEIKAGCANIIVRDNVIGGTRNPGITIYSTYSTDTTKRYQVYRNFLYGSPDSCIQCTSDADIYNNIFTNPSATCLNIRARTGDGKLQYVNVVNNTFFNAAVDLIGYRNGNIATNMVFANNALIQTTPSGQAFTAYDTPSSTGNTIINNVSYGYNSKVTSGFTDVSSPDVVFVNASTTLGQMDLYPVANSPLIDAGTNDPVGGFAIPTQDFNCLVRPNNVTTDVGAYEYYANSDTNPGWTLAAGLKPCVGVPGDADLDGHIILYDLKLLVPAWNSVTGEPAYNQNVDFDNNGVVEGADLRALVSNWNKFR